MYSDISVFIGVVNVLCLLSSKNICTSGATYYYPVALWCAAGEWGGGREEVNTGTPPCALVFKSIYQNKNIYCFVINQKNMCVPECFLLSYVLRILHSWQ